MGYRTEYETAMGARTDPKMNASATVGAKGFGNSQSLGSTLTSNEQGPLIKASNVWLGVAWGGGRLILCLHAHGLVAHAPDLDLAG